MTLFILSLGLALPSLAKSPGTSEGDGGQNGRFQAIGTAHGVGGVLNSLVGRGPSAGSERLYASYIYPERTFDVVSIDPATGGFHVYENPNRSEWGAWALTVGPDHNLYVGTLPHAHIYRLNPGDGSYVDLGPPAPTEQYIWQMAVGSDGKIYGCTYPSAKLVRMDPATGKGADLGRMDERENYARFIAASQDGFVYTGIGMGEMHIVGYEIATGKHRDILPDQHRGAGAAQVYSAADGRVYGIAGGQHFRLDGWTVKAIPVDDDPGPAPRDRLQSGNRVTIGQGSVETKSPDGKRLISRVEYGYKGRELTLFRLASGPARDLYASSILPIRLLRIVPDRNEITDLGGLGGGEFYSILNYHGRMLMAAYSGDAPLMVYAPERGFHPGRSAGDNPLLVNYSGQDSAWRPQALIEGPDGLVYAGAVAGYGKLGGPLVEWNVATGEVHSFLQVVHNQSVVSLAVAGKLLVAGTTVQGGGGSHPTEREAKLFLWDPETRKKVFETTPVPAEGSITDLVTVPGDQVFGFAGTTLFAFDLRARKVVYTAPHPFTGIPYNSAALGPDGAIWGLATDGIFRIDLLTKEPVLVARSPLPITAGFAMVGHEIYFAHGSTVYAYSMP